MIELRRAMVVEDVVGRTLEGVALTYGRTYRVSDDGGRTFYREGWRAGAVTASLAAMRNVFEFRRQHADERLGVVSFDDGETVLTFRATLDESEDGDAALADVESGKMRSVSLAFRPRRHEPPDDNGVLWRQRCDIRELSLTPIAQYNDAQVLAMRESSTLQEIQRLRLAGQRLLEYSRTV